MNEDKTDRNGDAMGTVMPAAGLPATTGLGGFSSWAANMGTNGLTLRSALRELSRTR